MEIELPEAVVEQRPERHCWKSCAVLCEVVCGAVLLALAKRVCVRFEMRILICVYGDDAQFQDHTCTHTHFKIKRRIMKCGAV